MRRQPPIHGNALWRLFLVSTVGCWTCTCGEASKRLADVVVGSNLNSQQYVGQVAGFGNQQNEQLFVPNLNLMLPPSNLSKLCYFPTIDDNTTAYYDMMMEDSHVNNRENRSVALFVSYGDCRPLDKAKVALDLRQHYMRYGTVTHLLVYNNDTNTMDELHTLSAFMPGDEFQDLSIIYVSTRSGRDIMKTIEQEERRQRLASPVIFEEGNEFWYLPVSFLEPLDYGQYSGEDGAGFNDIDPYNDNFGERPYPPQRHESSMPEADDFYWFRLIVFSLLVVSPCFRAAYLWYAGGARIRFRYNEQGRIIGLQYIPPMPYWFAPRPDDNYAHPPTCMTQEQVLALPEIVYEYTATPAEDEPSTTTTGSDKEGTQQSAAKEKDSTDHSNDKYNIGSIVASATESLATETNDESSNLEDPVSINIDVGQPAEPCYHSEMHSTCSICIDDFEQGERVRMLPRCRHIFHTDCILPWLTERQGCCPLCKTEVIEPEGGEVTSHSGHDQGGIVAPPASVSGSADVFSNEGHGEEQTSSTVQEQPQAQLNAYPELHSLSLTQPSDDPEIALPPENDQTAPRDGESYFHNEYDRIEEGQEQRRSR